MVNASDKALVSFFQQRSIFENYHIKNVLKMSSLELKLPAFQKYLLKKKFILNGTAHKVFNPIQISPYIKFSNILLQAKYCELHSVTCQHIAFLMNFFPVSLYDSSKDICFFINILPSIIFNLFVALAFHILILWLFGSLVC